MSNLEGLYRVNETIFIIFAVLMTVVPVLFFIGHVFTRNGREAVIENPFIGVYFVIFFAFAYFFWFEPETILSYVHIGYAGLNIVYWVMCIGVFFEKAGPMRP